MSARQRVSISAFRPLSSDGLTPYRSDTLRVRFQNLPFPYLVRPAQFLFNLSIIMVYAVPTRGRSGAKTAQRGGLSPGGNGRAAEIGETVRRTVGSIGTEGAGLECCNMRTQDHALEFVSLVSAHTCAVTSSASHRTLSQHRRREAASFLRKAWFYPEPLGQESSRLRSAPSAQQAVQLSLWQFLGLL